MSAVAKTVSVNSWAAEEKGSELTPFKFDDAAVSGSYVRIKVDFCGICGSDIHIIDNDWSSSQYPQVPGHEIAGTVLKVGPEVKNVKVGDRVGVGWVRETCGACDNCLEPANGDDQCCPNGKQTCNSGGRGGFAETIRVHSKWAIKIPDDLPSKYAAPLMCGGITVFSPLVKYAKAGDHVGIISMGGLGTMAVQFAKALGLHVTAISRGTGKKDLAMGKLGADAFCDSSDKKNLRVHKNEFKLLLNTSGHDQNWNEYLNTMGINSTLCFLGVPPTPLTVHVGTMLFKKITITASITGSSTGIKHMLRLAANYKIYPMIEEFGFKDVNTAIKKVRDNQVRFRAVLDATNFN
jgi:uncharacterized zinc-type alcohol dehydrogenase-like protein